MAPLGPHRVLVGTAATAAVVLLAVAGFALASSSRIALIVVAVVLPVLLVAAWTVHTDRHPKPREPDGADRDWVADVERFDLLRGDYAAYECDPVRVLRLPALADVTVASTARFVDAFAQAQSLRTEHHPGAAAASRFAAAVEGAEQAWHAARDAAERIGRSGLAPAELAAVERVIKLVTTARDSDSEPERVVAYARARAVLAGLVRAGVLHIPLATQAALDDGARGALPPADPR
jgi:hypothetical protein